MNKFRMKLFAPRTNYRNKSSFHTSCIIISPPSTHPPKKFSFYKESDVTLIFIEKDFEIFNLDHWTVLLKEVSTVNGKRKADHVWDFNLLASSAPCVIWFPPTWNISLIDLHLFDIGHLERYNVIQQDSLRFNQLDSGNKMICSRVRFPNPIRNYKCQLWSSEVYQQM